MKRILLLGLLIVSTGCEWLAKEATEKALETATGQEVDIDGQKITVVDENGKKTTIETGENKFEMKSDDGKIKMKANGDTAVVETEEGTMKFGASKLPEGFPLPMIDGAKIAFAADNEKSGKKSYTVACEVPGKSVEEIASFYEKALKDKWLTDIKKINQAAGGMTMAVLSGKQGKDIEAAVQITKAPNKEHPSVSVSWHQK